MHPAIISLLRPFVRLSLIGLPARLASVPHALDAPRAATEGPAPLSILILGYGVAPGYGVTTHALGMVGQLSRALSARTGRGVEVESASDNTTLPWLIGRLEGMDLSGYDAIVLSPGAWETITLMPESRWRRDLVAALSRARFQDGERPVVLLGVPPLASIVPTTSPFGQITRRYGKQLESLLAELSLDPMVEFVPLQTAIDPADIRPAAPERYRAWADAVATALVSRLPCPSPIAAPPAGDTTGRLAGLVRSALGAEGVIIATADGQHVWTDARRSSRAPLAAALPELLAATAREPRSDTLAPVEQWTVIVHPVTSDDGHPLGMLAIVDSDPDGIDRRLLGRLSVMVRQELTEEAPTTVEA